MRVLKRVLTRKSILGFGYSNNRDLSVQMILDLGRGYTLISSYFNLEKIDFIEDILDELGITPEFRIEKPNKDRELFNLFLEHRKNQLTEKEMIIECVQKLKEIKHNRRLKNNSKSFLKSAEYLRSKNHGNR